MNWLESIYHDASRIFDDPDAADEWMNTPHPALAGRAPFQAAMTEEGAGEVRAILTRIEDGVHG